MTKHDPYEVRVARGATVLDDIAPSWRENTDVMRLNLASPFSCMLGQNVPHDPGLLNGFSKGLLLLEQWADEHPEKVPGFVTAFEGETYTDALIAAFGFNLYLDEDQSRSEMEEFDDLTAAWVSALGYDPETLLPIGDDQ